MKVKVFKALIRMKFYIEPYYVECSGTAPMDVWERLPKVATKGRRNPRAPLRQGNCRWGAEDRHPQSPGGDSLGFLPPLVKGSATPAREHWGD